MSIVGNFNNQMQMRLTEKPAKEICHKIRYIISNQLDEMS